MSLVSTSDYLARSLERPVVVVGHSMGGIIGMFLAERHPDLVSMLVNVEGNASSGDCVYSGPAAAYSAEEFAQHGIASVISFIDEKARGDPAHRGYAKRIRQADPATFHTHARELVAISDTEEVAPRLARLPVPVVYIAGSPDGACARSIELLLAAGVPTVTIAPSGHWPFVDQPEQFAQVLSQLVSDERISFS